MDSAKRSPAVWSLISVVLICATAQTLASDSADLRGGGAVSTLLAALPAGFSAVGGRVPVESAGRAPAFRPAAPRPQAPGAIKLTHKAPGAVSGREPGLLVPMPHEDRAYRRTFRIMLSRTDVIDRYDEIILRMSRDYGLDPRLVKAIIAAESEFDPKARSPRNARGLMQVLPATAGEMGVNGGRLHDPEWGTLAGVRYLDLLFRAAWLRYRLSSVRYQDAPLWLVQRVVAAYHAGPRALARDRWKPETRAYVRKVFLFYQTPVTDIRRFPEASVHGSRFPRLDTSEGILF